jgi:hypothetical protein
MNQIPNGHFYFTANISKSSFRAFVQSSIMKFLVLRVRNNVYIAEHHFT